MIGGFSESDTQQFLANFALSTAFGMDPSYYSAWPWVFSRSAPGKCLLEPRHRSHGFRPQDKELYYPALGAPELESNRVLAKTIGYNFAADGLLNLFGEFFIHRGF